MSNQHGRQLSFLGVVQPGNDCYSHLLGEDLVAESIEVDIVFILQLRESRLDRSAKVGSWDAMLLHDFVSDAVQSLALFRRKLFGILHAGWRGRARPYQFCSGGFQYRDDLLEVAGISIQRKVAIMDAEVEVDHVPFSGTKPLLQLLDPLCRRTAIGRGAMNVHFACECLANGMRVTARDRISDEQHAWQAWIVLDKSHAVTLPASLSAL